MNYVSQSLRCKEVSSGSVNAEWQYVRLSVRQLVEKGAGELREESRSSPLV